MNSGDKMFFKNMGVPDSNGISHPKLYPFYVSENNPNPTGGCLCEHSETVGPYVVFPGDMLDINSPRPVLCSGCVPCIDALLKGSPLPDMPEAKLIELQPEEYDEVEGL
jgi:hypothetical protein